MMRKILFALFIAVIVSMGRTFGQSFDWNVRGGLNLMKSHTPGKDVSVLYHVGLQAGIRIASFGFYGEALYSMNENQYGGDAISYLIPSLIVKGYWQKHIFVEIGGSYLSKTGDSGVKDDIFNPDGKVLMLGGLGAKIYKLELSLRTIVKQSQSYGMMQVTVALKF
jgi:hypothetical protein